MITFGNQFTYTFSLMNPDNSKDIETDFIDAENLKEFLMHVAAGNVCPTLEMTFELERTNLIHLLNKGNILTVSFGITEKSVETIQFQLLDDNMNKNFTLGYAVKISAIFYKPKFMATRSDFCYNDKTSLQVLKQLAEKHKFNFVTNITKTVDKQSWNKLGKSDWEFIEEVWLPSYISSKTFTAFAFDYDTMYFYDVRDLCSKPAKWIFSNKKMSKVNTGVVPISSYFTKNVSGSIDDLIGRAMKIETFNIDKEKFSVTPYQLKNFSTISNNLDLNQKNCENYNYFICSGDQHPNYVMAYNQNVRNNIMYSSFNIYTTSAIQFNDIRLLDTVSFDVNPADARIKGTAFVTELAYQFVDGRFNVNITLNKEAPNGLVSDNLSEGEDYEIESLLDE